MAGGSKKLLIRTVLVSLGIVILTSCQFPFGDQPTPTPSVPDLSATVIVALQETSEINENTVPPTQASSPATQQTGQNPPEGNGVWQGQWFVNIETLPVGLRMQVDQRGGRLDARMASDPDSYRIDATLLEDQRTAEGALYLNDNELASIRWELSGSGETFNGFWSVPPNQGAFCGARSAAAMPEECPD